MKNSAKFVLALMLTAASAASCLKEIAVRGEGSGELTLNPQVDALTKAPIAGKTFPADRTIVLSAYNNGTSANFFQGITFKKNATLDSWAGGGGTDPKYWPVSGTLDLLAYSADGFTTAPAPSYATKCSESVTLTVPAENRTKQVDILFAGATDKSATGSALAMQFKHAQAVVAFNAKAQVPYDATKNLGVTIDKITLGGVKTYGTVTLKIDGTCSWTDGTAENVDLTGMPTGGYPVIADYIDIATTPFGIGNDGIIVIPQTATKFTVNYTVHYGKDSSSNPVNKTETFTYTIPSATWEAGKEYVYQLEFKQDQILVNTEILDWAVIPGGVTVPDKVSATYRDSDPAKTDINLCAPGIPAKLSAGAIVGFDWGDGRYEIIENTTGSEMALASILHKYPAPPTGCVNIYVRRGTLDFGELEAEYFNLFTVYNDTEVIVTLFKYTINKAAAANGSFDVSHDKAVAGETITVSPSPNTDYVVNEVKYNDGSDHTVSPVSGAYSFTMHANDVTVTVTFKRETGTINGHDYVKIAGIKWATTNIGASTPADYGEFYAWGETLTKSDYSLSTYTVSGSVTDISPTSGKDVARVKWGSPWRMPKSSEFKALYNATTWTWKDSGYYLTEKGVALNSDKSNALLFFPAAGYYRDTSRSEKDSSGYYWSSTYFSYSDAYYLYFYGSYVDPQYTNYRYCGRSVRPVSE